MRKHYCNVTPKLQGLIVGLQTYGQWLSLSCPDLAAHKLHN